MTCLAILCAVVSATAWADEPARWWSFQPLHEPQPPAIQGTTWPRSDVDRFVLARLEARGMLPVPAADKRTLLRRVTFDLTGLPPTPVEMAAFLADDDPEAFARVVDRLLASPHYGQRWGRHWLDVVRYADTSGCNGDFPVPEAYRYRNYVVDAFNQDKPFDQFVREQLAGDLLPAQSQPQREEQIVATGYLAISRRFSSLNEEFHLTLDDAIDNLGKAFLGLSISCARCHDHKFDPIPQPDYYALYGIFQSTTLAFPGTEIYRHAQDMVPLVSPEQREGELRPYLEQVAALDAEIFRIYTRMAELDTGKERNALRDQWQKLAKERDELTKQRPDFPRAYAASEGKALNARLHLKGDPEKLGGEVVRGFPQALGGQPLEEAERGSGRRQLAEWIVAQPLLARVFANRVWQHHFGRGLVATPDDFGTRGSPPSHPELLEFLARRFMQSGWSVKALHRLILMSATYQMASVENPAYAEQDPQNELLWTFNRRRLSAEEIRDAILACSGALDRSFGGPHPFKPEWEWRYTQHRPFIDDFPTRRRSIYLMQQRQRLQPYLDVFDGADTNAATGLRKVSTTPQQALFMLNSEFMHEQAGLFADRLEREVPETGRIARAYQIALGRLPSPKEEREARAYIAEIAADLADTEVEAAARHRAAWASYWRVLFSGNEFMFVD